MVDIAATIFVVGFVVWFLVAVLGIIVEANR